MADIRATPIANRPAYYAAGLLNTANEAVSRPFGFENDPVRALSNLLGVPSLVKTLENVAYGMPNVTGSGMATRLRPEAVEALTVVAPTAPKAALLAAKGAVKAGKYAAPVVGDALENYAAKTGINMYAYRPSTPLKPDPSLGTRFEREFIGGLAEKTPVKLEDLQGSSLMLMPWDSTSRNYRIKSISDELLANPVITHGGQDYARDLSHIQKNVAGASNLGIAKRIQNRDAQARIENLEAGGTGQVISLPTTMGDYSEFFSVMPTEAIFGLLDARPPSKKVISEIDKAIRASKAPGEDRLRMKNFKGLMSEEGRMQLLTGEGLDTTAGNARIAVMTKLALKGNQEKLGFNLEDLSAALTDPALAGVPKGYIGNTVIATGKEGMHLRPSINPSYNTDFTGNYLGTLGANVPVEVLFPKTFDSVLREMAGKKGSLRNMAIGALEKRKAGFSELVDQQVIDNYYKYLDEQRRLGLGGQ
jgi:hypothetical protein